MRARFFAAAVLALVACKPSQDKPAEAVALGVITGLSGVTEPCGCTSKPLGGLDRMGGVIEAEQKKNPAFALALSGDTFVELDDPPAHRFEAERNKAQVIVEVLQRLQPRAIARGKRDLGMHERFVEDAAKAAKLTLLKPPASPQTRSRIDSSLFTVGGLRIGMLGTPGSAIPESDAYTAGALALRAQGADIVVALVPERFELALRLAPHLDRIDVVVSGGSDELHEPVVVDEALVVTAGDKGRYLGLLEFHRRGSNSWVYDDEGKAAAASVDRRIERLKAELQGLEEGEAKVARQAKLNELEAEKAKAVGEKPTTSFVTWRTVEITKAQTPAVWATDKLKAYNVSLCPLMTEATASRECAAPTEPGVSYVGNESCKACHADAFSVYAPTKHAHAWQTLTDAGKSCDLGCIGCHTVGFEQPGGFCKLSEATTWQNVGCESCHGPGGGHAKNPGDKKAWGTRFTRANDEKVCKQCHNTEHSDQFDFATYLPQILGPGHGAKK